MNRDKRLARELEKIQKTPSNGILADVKTNNVWNVRILGPHNSPYKEGTFNLEVCIPSNYPFSPPALKFITKVFHPNIDDNGRICMDLLKMPPSGNWRPTIGIEGLLIAVRTLLENPNPRDPLMVDTAALFEQDREAFNKQAEEYTIKYAKSN